MQCYIHLFISVKFKNWYAVFRMDEKKMRWGNISSISKHCSLLLFRYIPTFLLSIFHTCWTEPPFRATLLFGISRSHRNATTRSPRPQKIHAAIKRGKRIHRRYGRRTKTTGRTGTDGHRVDDDDRTDDGTDGRKEDDDGDDGTRRDTTGRTEDARRRRDGRRCGRTEDDDRGRRNGRAIYSPKVSSTTLGPIL